MCCLCVCKVVTTADGLMATSLGINKTRSLQMIEKISGKNYPETFNQKSVSNTVYDIHNISPKELDELTLQMFKNGEINLKDRLPFIPLDTNIDGKNTHLKYYSRVWDNIDMKRDMIKEFTQILKEQISDKDDQMNIKMTRDAIALLERIDKKLSFNEIFANQIEKIS
jgi:hypothetical protein